MLAAVLLFMLSACVDVSRQSPVRRDARSPKTYAPSNSSRSSRRLSFNQDGTFQISIFEDLHFGETKQGRQTRADAWDQWGPQQDINSVKVMDAVLDSERPDLVVLNGDLITGENTYLENSTAYMDQIAGPLVARGLPWASTYGNHDHNFNISGAGLLARERRWPNSLTRSMVAGRDAGVTNYYLPVYAADCAPELLLWFFDSRGGFYFRERGPDGRQVGQPDWVDASVVRWFEATSAALRRRSGRVVPSLAFVHIPANASLAVQPGVDAHRQPGVDDDVPLARQAQGWCADGSNGPECVYGGQDEPFMRAVAATPGLIGLFSGHDHGATWCYKWDRLVPGMTVAGTGLNLCFGQHSGYGGYGNWIRGARQLRLSADALRRRRWEADTWIRTEKGGVVGRVSLNATYGKDWYPATPNEKTYCPTCNYTVITPGPRRR
ncbi:putative inactive purple acid phosphatase 16 [Metarhizium anisopliae]